MNQKSSLIQILKFVPKVLTSDIIDIKMVCCECGGYERRLVNIQSIGQRHTIHRFGRNHRKAEQGSKNRCKNFQKPFHVILHDQYRLFAASFRTEAIMVDRHRPFMRPAVLLTSIIATSATARKRLLRPATGACKLAAVCLGGWWSLCHGITGQEPDEHKTQIVEKC